MNESKVCGIIPAYKPDFKLTETLRQVTALDFLESVVVVDDGSGNEFQNIFDDIAKMPCVNVVHLGVNSGAGGATKEGLQYAIYHYPDALGFVTFDADGQHHPEDVRKIVETFGENPDKLVVGVRNFHDPALHIPLRSRFGNRVTEDVFHVFTGIHLTDTQSGLRCYPMSVARKITQILHSRYEFLLEALLVAADMTDYVQVPIRTIYEDGNKRSHFNPVLDSLRIYAVFFRFIGSSLFCSVIDYILFAILFLTSSHVLFSLIISRIISVSINFFVNKRKVFSAGGNVIRQAVGFACLALGLFAGSYFGIALLQRHCELNPLWSKIIVEVLLFFASFVVQRFLIFTRKK